MFCNQKQRVSTEVADIAWRNGFDLITDFELGLSELVNSVDENDTLFNELKSSFREQINSAIEAKQKSEHNLKLCKNRLEILEAKESKEEEYRKRIHELETKLAVANGTVASQMLVIEQNNNDMSLLNNRIDKLIDLKIKPQQVKVIKGSNSDVKIIK